jgi:hypothetical protein
MSGYRYICGKCNQSVDSAFAHTCHGMIEQSAKADGTWIWTQPTGVTLGDIAKRLDALTAAVNRLAAAVEKKP